MSLLWDKGKTARRMSATLLRRLVPLAAQPVGQQADRLRVEDFFIAESGHAVVAFAVVGRVFGIGQQADDPAPRTVAGEVGGGGVFVLLAELVAYGAAELRAQQAAAFADEGGILLVDLDLRLQLGFGGERGDDFLQVVGLDGRISRHFLFDKLDHLAFVEFGGPEVVRGIDLFRVEQTGDPFAGGEALEISRGGRVVGNFAGGIVAAETMATRAMFAEEFRALDVRIVAQERGRAAAGNARGRFRQNFNTLRAALGFSDAGQVGGALLVLGQGQVSEQARARE